MFCVMFINLYINNILDYVHYCIKFILYLSHQQKCYPKLICVQKIELITS